MTAREFDLVVMVPDLDIEQVVLRLLTSRRRSLGIRAVRFEVLRSVRRDAGVVREAEGTLRTFLARAGHALVILDHEGSGRESEPREKLAGDLEAVLSRSGWQQRAKVIVIAPELENWVWSDSPRVPHALRWQCDQPLRDWLESEGCWPRDALKPPRPEEALEKVLLLTQRRRLPALYGELADTVGLERCIDPAFRELRSVLTSWFPPA